MSSRSIRHISMLLCIAAVGCEQSSDAPDAARPTGAASDPTVTQRAAELPPDVVLDRASDGSVKRIQHGELASHVSESAAYSASLATRDFASMALEFLDTHKQAFRLLAPRDELTVVRIQADQLGYHHVRFSQTFSGIPVAGTDLIVHFNADDALYSVNGNYIPTPEGLRIEPVLSRSEAAQRASAQLAPGSTVSGGSLVIAIDHERRPRLGYEFQATKSIVERYRVVVDAMTGEYIDTESLIVE